MAFNFIWLTVVCLVLSGTEARLTGERCRDFENKFAIRWQRCSGSCCYQSCNCVWADRRLQADCETACHRVILPPGCTIGEPFQNATHMDCCPAVCPAEPVQRCGTSFGGNYAEGERWVECNSGTGCCFKSCQCVRRGSGVAAECSEACPRVRITPGCNIGEPFQNATHRDCCRIECPPEPEQQCRTSFGGNYAEGEEWEECSPSRECCFKSCQCVRRGSHLAAQCHEACPSIRLPPGCTIGEPFQNATHRDCCRRECLGSGPQPVQLPSL